MSDDLYDAITSRTFIKTFGRELILFRNIKGHLRPYLKQCILGPIFKLLEAVLELIMPILMARLIDNGVAVGDRGYILKIGGIMILTAATGLISAIICQYLASVTSQGFGTSLRSAMFKKINSLNSRTLDKFGAITFTNRLTNDINQLQQGVAMLIRLVIRAPFICIGSIVAAMLIDIKLSAITLGAVLLFGITLAVIIKLLGPMYMKIQKRLDNLGRVINENLSGVRVIRAFAKTDRERARFGDVNDGWTKDAIRAGRIATLVSPVTMIIINLSVTAIVWFGGIRVDNAGMTQGELIAFINYMTQVLNALIVLSNLVLLYTKAYASLGRVNEVMDLSSGEEGSRNIEPDYTAPAVEFERVTFRYGDEAEPELKDISFTLCAGETIGIIGGTGSGKSTLINLVPALYTSFTGDVKVFGQSVKEYDKSVLRGFIGFVPQRAQLFSGTVKDNIAFGSDNIGDEEISEAVEQSSSDFVNLLGDGVSSRVERGGRNFSGGQKQRLTIARAIALKPRILILDDAMSAVDYATELRLRKAVRRLTKENGMSAIIVTQRISSIAYADKILVLDDGKTAGIGTHDQLMQSCEVYRDIALSQQSGGAVK